MEDGTYIHGYNHKVVNTFGSSDLNYQKNLTPECALVDDAGSSSATTDDAASSSDSTEGESMMSPVKSSDEYLMHTGSQRTSRLIDVELTQELGREIYDASDYGSVAAFIANRIENGLEDAAFMACNLAPIINQFHQWKKELPMVEPFYAIKCNPDPAIVRLLSTLGCGFDCATMGEMDLVLNGLGDELNFGARGLASKLIVYANPAKMINMIKFAQNNDVKMTVFDGEDELRKIASVGGHNFDLLLRLATDDKSSVCQFSLKFGCPVDEAPKLLAIAKSLGLKVAGVSFHVGSGCGDSGAYITALEHSRQVFEAAEALGMPPMTIVDIGGGFPGDKGGYGGPGMPSFQDLAAAVRTGITVFGERLGRPLDEIRFIAEPGRYFVSASTVLATQVYARKGGNENHQALYVDDGVYGSFNNIVYDHYAPTPIKLNLRNKNNKPYINNNNTADTDDKNIDEECIPTAVFGPTCDGLDQMCSLENTKLQRCSIGDWIIWENMGAYTHTASYVFNGYSHIPSKVHCIL